MKPIRLELSAFESYYDDVVIDFERLSQDGVFLILGDTGSGKTAIFDGISYALFGEMSEPQRTDERTIKNLDAGPDKLCFVKFEFMEKGKSYSITRSPAQTLNSKKKVVTKASQVCLSFLDEDEPDITAIKVANAKIQEIIGLNSNQFFQVSLIAQGAFAKILTCETKERRDILENIFKTFFYQDFTNKLKEKKDEIDESYKNSQTKIDSLYDSVDLVTDEEKAKKTSLTSDDDRLVFLEEKAEEYGQKKEAAKAALQDLEKKNNQLLSEQKEREEYDQNIASLKKASADLKAENENLIRLQDEKLALEKEKPDIDKNRKEEIQLRGQFSEYDKLDELLKKEKEASANAANAKAEVETAKAAVEKISQQLSDGQKREAEIESLLSDEVSVSKQSVELDQQIKDGEKVSELLEDTKGDLKEYQLAISDALAKQNAYSKVLSEDAEKQEIYFQSMGATLAKNLKDNEPCPVCGSLSHPHPATFSGKEISKKDLDISKKAVDRANSELAKAKQNCAALASKVKQEFKELDTSFSGNTEEKDYVDHLRSYASQQKANEASWTEEKRSLDAKKKEFEALHEEKDNLVSSINQWQDCLTAKNGEITKASQDYATYRSQEESYNTQWKEKKESLSYSSLAEAEKRADSLKQRYEDYQKRVEENGNKISESQRICENNKGTIKVFTTKTASFKGRELEVISNEMEALHTQKLSLEGERETYTSALDSVKNAYTRMKKEITNSRSLLSRYSLLNKLYGIYTGVKGNGGSDDKRGLHIETYVLSYYLDRILEKASLRLKNMSGGQFMLVRRVDPNKGSGQQGLDIDVIHLSTGQRIPASSLSGGETFMASISLALGLSDYVKESIGNYRIETLFIDEGFGTLSEEYLQRVVAVISSLSAEENTTVGLISHIKELQPYFPRQLYVRKDRSGHSKVSYSDSAFGAEKL